MSDFDSKPFLSIVTRCCHRPEMLRKNILSVMAQTDWDIEQIYIIDNRKRGLNWANCSFAENKHRVDGQYVFMLDDDGKFVQPKFVSRLKNVVGMYNFPDVVIMRNKRFVNGAIVPPRHIWRLNWEAGERPKEWIGNGYCLAVRADVWKQHIHNYCPKSDAKKTGMDWHFTMSLLDSGCSFARLNCKVAEGMQRGRGDLFENTKDKRWFRPVAKRFGIGSDLKLKLYERERPQ